jgi:hypothetical protein
VHPWLVGSGIDIDISNTLVKEYWIYLLLHEYDSEDETTE